MGTSRLGNLLVEEGLLTETDRRTIKRECGSQGAAFAKSIVALGLLDEDELAAFLAERTSHPVAPKDLASITSNAALGVVDRPLIERLEVVPLDFKNNTLSVAMADPLDQDALAQLSFFTGYRIRPVIATFRQIHTSLSGLLPDFKPQRSTFEEFLRNHVLAASTHLKALDPNAGKAAASAGPEPKISFEAPLSPPEVDLPDDGSGEDMSFDEHASDPVLGEKDAYGDFAESSSDDLSSDDDTLEIEDTGFADDDLDTDLSHDMESETIIDEETDASFSAAPEPAPPPIEIDDGQEAPGDLTSGDDIDALFEEPGDDSDAADSLTDDIALGDADGTQDLVDELSASPDESASAVDDDIFAQASAELAAAGELPEQNEAATASEPSIEEATPAEDDTFALASAELAAAGELPSEDETAAETASADVAEPDLFDQLSAEMASTIAEPPAVEVAPAAAEETATEPALPDEPAAMADFDEFDLDDSEEEPAIEETSGSSAQDDVDALFADEDPLESFASSRAELDDSIEASAAEPIGDDIVDEFEATAVEETDAALAAFADESASVAEATAEATNSEETAEAPEPPADFSDFDVDEGDLEGLGVETDDTEDVVEEDEDFTTEDLDSEEEEATVAEVASAAPASSLSPQEKIRATAGLNSALISLALVRDRPSAADALAKALRGAGFVRGVLLSVDGDFLCEWTGDDPVQYEPQSHDYQTPGLGDALRRLSEEWSDFSATTRDENLSAFEGWKPTLVAMRVPQTGVACVASHRGGIPDATLAKLASQVLKQASRHIAT